MDEQQQAATNTSPAKDSTPKVIGIGGVFFYSDNPAATKDWYAKHLRFDINDWGSSSFAFRDVNNPEEVGSLEWCAFKREGQHFAPSKKEFMINYRVQNIEGLVEQFRADGVTVLNDIVSYDYGKFVHIMDGEGNKIELWEPA